MDLSYLAILWIRKWLVVVTEMVTISIVAIGTQWITLTYAASRTLHILTAKNLVNGARPEMKLPLTQLDSEKQNSTWN